MDASGRAEASAPGDTLTACGLRRLPSRAQGGSVEAEQSRAWGGTAGQATREAGSRSTRAGPRARERGCLMGVPTRLRNDAQEQQERHKDAVKEPRKARRGWREDSWTAWGVRGRREGPGGGGAWPPTPPTRALLAWQTDPARPGPRTVPQPLPCGPTTFLAPPPPEEAPPMALSWGRQTNATGTTGRESSSGPGI